ESAAAEACSQDCDQPGTGLDLGTGTEGNGLGDRTVGQLGQPRLASLSRPPQGISLPIVVGVRPIGRGKIQLTGPVRMAAAAQLGDLRVGCVSGRQRDLVLEKLPL